MTGVYVAVSILIAIWIALVIYVFSEAKKIYAKNRMFTGKLLNSWFAGAAAIAIYLYTVRLAEPYLELLYGKDYCLHKSRNARWIKIPLQNKKTTQTATKAGEGIL